MRKVFLAGFMLCAFTATQAQTKIGYIDTDELISVMPEAAKADSTLKEFQASLGQQYQDLSIELNNKDSVFVADSSKLSPSMKAIKRKELIDLYQRVQNYQQESQELYQQEANAKIAPIREKAMNAIKAVAKEAGYAYILNADNLLVMPPGDNILALVKTKLGISANARPMGSQGAARPAGRN